MLKLMCYRLTDIPVKAGDMFFGSVHWKRCLLLPDHRSTITITRVEEPSAFRSVKPL
jgi:hypothetical protein